MTTTLFFFISIMLVTLFLIVREEKIYSYNTKRTVRVHRKTRKVQYKIDNEWTEKL